VAEREAGTVYVEPVTGADGFAARLEQLERDIASGSWVPPELPAETKARLAKSRAKSEAYQAWAEAHPVAAGLKQTARIGVLAIIVAALTLFEPTPDLADIGRAGVVVLVVSTVAGALTTLSLKRGASRESP
jgi:hypothetical protein